MNKNRILIITTIILAVLAAVLFYSRSNTTINSKISDFSVPDTASITKIFLADKENQTILLEKASDGIWKLNKKYDAHPENMQIFLQTLTNIQLREPVAKAAHNNIIGFLAVKSTKVEIYQIKHRISLGKFKFFPHEKLTKTFYIGDATMDNTGTFALMEGAKAPVVIYVPGLRGFISTRFSTSESDWRTHTVFNKKLPDIKSIKVEFLTQPEESYIVENVNNQHLKLIRLKDNQEINGYDTLRLVSFVNAFRKINYETLLNDMEPSRRDSIMQAAPMHRITLETKTGQTQSIRTFVRLLPQPEVDVFDGSVITYDMDRLYGYVNDEDFVTIQFFAFDKVLLPLSMFTHSNQNITAQ